MRRLLFLGLLLLSAPLLAAHPKVKVETTAGDFVLELYPDKAPKTVANFLRYVKEGFYDGTVFHRVIDGFMVQGGGFVVKDGELERKSTHAPIPNEADNGLSNERGTIAMARTSQPDSATAQFFINLVDNGFLDFKEKSRRGWGYAVFGKVVEGMDTLDRIAKLTTTARPGGMRNVPIEPPVIRRMVLLAPPPEPKEAKPENAPAEQGPMMPQGMPSKAPGMPNMQMPGMQMNPPSLQTNPSGMRHLPGMPQNPATMPEMQMPGMQMNPPSVQTNPAGMPNMPGMPRNPPPMPRGQMPGRAPQMPGMQMNPPSMRMNPGETPNMPAMPSGMPMNPPAGDAQ